MGSEAKNESMPLARARVIPFSRNSSISYFGIVSLGVRKVYTLGDNLTYFRAAIHFPFPCWRIYVFESRQV